MHPYARVGVVIAENDNFASWYLEILHQFGLVVEVLDGFQASRLPELDVLLLCGRGAELPYQKILRDWLVKGGAIVASGGTWGLEEFLGWSTEDEGAIGTESLEGSIVYGGLSRKVTTATVLNVLGSGKAGVTVNDRCWTFAPHVGQTMALAQLGRSVDVVPEGSRSGKVTFEPNTLRSECGIRLPLDSNFSNPTVDQLTTDWFHVVLDAIHATNRRAALLWPWPAGAPMATIVSLQARTPDPDGIYALERAVNYTSTPFSLMCNSAIQSADNLRRFRQAGAEIGLLALDADNEDHFEEKFKIQLVNLTRLSGQGQVLSAVLDQGRWHGFTSIYEIAAKSGIRITSTKGGSQAATEGFIYGTCRPFFVRNARAELLKLIEVPFAFSNPNTANTDLIDQVAKFHGCAHISLSCPEINAETQLAVLRQLVVHAKEKKSVFLTLDRLAQFEFARRCIRASIDRSGQLVLKAELGLRHLAIYSSMGSHSTLLGQKWDINIVNLQPRTELRLESIKNAA